LVRLVRKDLAWEGVVLEVAWVGVDVGKAHHWVVAEDPGPGGAAAPRKVANDQQEIARVVAGVGKLAGRLVWAVDLTTAEAAPLLAVLFSGGQTVRYLSGRAVNQAAASYRGGQDRRPRRRDAATPRRPRHRRPGPDAPRPPGPPGAASR
jgi:hypothetical protein